MSAPTTTRPLSASARARAKHARVVKEAGTQGHVDPNVPTRRFRTDIVPPMLSFVVYGIPAAQGSKRPVMMASGKPGMKEQNESVAPWRESVRHMARKATQEWSRTNSRPWVALDAAVMVSAVVTVPATAAATARNDIYAQGVPDLDKMERAIGDALAPVPLRPADGKGLPEAARKQARTKMLAQRRAVCVLHDDSRITCWDRTVKVFPATTVDSLGYSGVTIRLWLMNDLDRADRKPVVYQAERTYMQAMDLRAWARPLSGRTWDEEAARAWRVPYAVLDAPAMVTLRGRGIAAQGIGTVLKVLALGSPDTLIEVHDEPARR